MDNPKKEEFVEKIYYLMLNAYKYMYQTGKENGYWEDIRGTALAGIAFDLKEEPNSLWIRLIRNKILSDQIKDGEVAGSWGEEIWDTAMCILALKSFELSSKDPVIKNSIEWISSLYQVNKRNNWHDEPWETCWALIAILTIGTIPSNLKIEDPIDWLIDFQEKDGRIIAPHYTAYFLLIYEKLKKIELNDTIRLKFDKAKNLSLNYLKNLLSKSDDAVLWSGEAWANGQILWAICSVDNSFAEDEEITEKILLWFENNQGKQGNWSDIEDTSSAIIGLHKLLEILLNSSDFFEFKNIRSTLQKRLPSPIVYIKKPFIEKHHETGGFSLNFSNRMIKIITLAGAIGAGIGTFLGLSDYFIQLFKHG